MNRGAKIGLAALVAAALFVGAFGVTLLASDRGDGGSQKADAPPETGAVGEMPYLDDVAKMCALVTALHAEAPDGARNEARFMHDRLTRLSVNSSPEIQGILASYIHGFALSAEGPERGQEALDASNALLDGRSRIIQECTAVGAPGYG